MPSAFYDAQYNFFSRLNSIYNEICYDRFGIIDFANPYNVGSNFDELPTFNTNDMCLQSIILDQAKQYIDNYNNIAVAWSGGVDSTGILAALLTHQIDPKRIHVIYTSKSIDEYPNFYNHLINIGCRLTNNDQSVSNPIPVFESLEDDVILFGWGADQLYHYYKIYDQRTDSNKDWKIVLRDKYPHRFNKHIDNDIALLEYYQQQLNWKCNTFFELSLLSNLCFKYTGLKDWFQSLCNDDKTRNKVSHFYMGPRFLNWGYCNRGKTTWYFNQNNPYYYKPEIKQLIYSYNHDDHYLKYKNKVPSWGKQYDKQPFKSFEVMYHDIEGYHKESIKISKHMPYEQRDMICSYMFNKIMQPYCKNA